MDLVVIIPVAVFVVLVGLFLSVKIWIMSDDERRDG